LFTAVINSLIATVPLPSQSPQQPAGGVTSPVGVAVVWGGVVGVAVASGGGVAVAGASGGAVAGGVAFGGGARGGVAGGSGGGEQQAGRAAAGVLDLDVGADVQRVALEFETAVAADDLLRRRPRQRAYCAAGDCQALGVDHPAHAVTNFRGHVDGTVGQ